MKLKYYLRGLGIGILVTGLIMGISNKKAVSQAKDEVRKVYEQELREQETGEALSDQISEASDENEESQESPSVQETAGQELVQQNPSMSETEEGSNTGTEEASIENDTRAEEDASKTDNTTEANESNKSENTDIESDSNKTNNTDADNEANKSENAGTDSSQEANGGNGSQIVIDADNNDADNNDTNNNTSKDSVKIKVSGGDDSGVVSRKLYNAGLIENATEFDAFLMQHGYDKKIATGEKTFYAGESWQEIAEKLIKN